MIGVLNCMAEYMPLGDTFHFGRMKNESRTLTWEAALDDSRPGSDATGKRKLTNLRFYRTDDNLEIDDCV